MKGKKKQALSMVLALSLSVFTIADGANIASAKAKLTRKTLALTVGQKKKIAIKGKKKKAVYTFSSSNKKAVVSKKGMVTAKKKGTAKITVKEKYKKKTRKVGTVTITIKSKGVDKTSKPNLTPKPTDSPTATPTNTTNATPTVTPTATPSTTSTTSPTPKPTPVVTAKASESPGTTGPTVTPTTTPSASPSVTPSANPKVTPTPTITPPPFAENPEMVVPFDALSKNGPTGNTEVFTYKSTAVAEGKTVDRQALVAFPVNYKTTKTYPVVYGLHGYGWGIYNLANDGATNVAWNGYGNDTMDEVIMVFPNICANESGQGQGHDQATYDAYDNCVDDIVGCLMPAIEENYPVKKGRNNTAVWGFSMGGREALNLGFKHPELFGYIGAFCPAPGVLPYSAEKGIFTEDTFKLPEEYNGNTLVMIVKGAKDSTVGDNPLLYHNALNKNGTIHTYYETMGGDERNRGGGGHYKLVYLHGLYNLMKRAFPST